MSSYSEKFKDPRWQKKRLEILNRDKFSCQICFDEKSTLNIHHKYYEENKDPWDYKKESLITLCNDCHEAEQESKKEYESLLIKTLYNIGFLSDDLREIAWGFSNFKLKHVNHVVSNSISAFFLDKNTPDKLINNYFKNLKKRAK